MFKGKGEIANFWEIISHENCSVAYSKNSLWTLVLIDDNSALY